MAAGSDMHTRRCIRLLVIVGLHPRQVISFFELGSSGWGLAVVLHNWAPHSCLEFRKLDNNSHLYYPQGSVLPLTHNWEGLPGPKGVRHRAQAPMGRTAGRKADPEGASALT